MIQENENYINRGKSLIEEILSYREKSQKDVDDMIKSNIPWSDVERLRCSERKHVYMECLLIINKHLPEIFK